MRTTPQSSLFDAVRKHYTRVCHCEWSEDDQYTTETNPECLIHGDVRDPLAVIESHVANLHELLREWSDLGDLHGGGYGGTLRARTEAELGRLTVAE